MVAARTSALCRQQSLGPPRFNLVEKAVLFYSENIFCDILFSLPNITLSTVEIIFKLTKANQ